MLAEGREQSWELLTSFRRLRRATPSSWSRKHLTAGCPRDARTPLVIRGLRLSQVAPRGRSRLVPEWQHIHDNHFLAELANTGRLANNIREA